MVRFGSKYFFNLRRSFVRLDFNPLASTFEIRKCTKCDVFWQLKYFHKKGERRASRCVFCIRKEKIIFRKSKSCYRSRVIRNKNKLRCQLSGRLTPSTILSFSLAFSDFLMRTKIEESEEINSK